MLVEFMFLILVLLVFGYKLDNIRGLSFLLKGPIVLAKFYV